MVDHEVPLPPQPTGPGLWLGDDSLSKNPAGLAELAITHRLQCNMNTTDADRWMAENWSCDCPGCPSAVRREAFLASFAEQQPADAKIDALSFGEELALSMIDPDQGILPNDETGVVHAYLPLFDDEPFAREHGSRLLREGAKFINHVVDVLGSRIYVHCEKGCSRSASVVVQYLVEYRGMNLLQAAEYIKNRRCRVSPNGGFVEALVRNEQACLERNSETGRSKRAAVSDDDYVTAIIAAFRKPWLADFRAGKVRPHPVDRII
eukprot:TRINITY_DN60031_c0_g1_i1.p1 TRINITY_DN60031_c0_g1~~TRINITY_DN60031_c0_g1_i1.p1  ORF type:complete len:264 (-),score=16.56 TRINITY_DN60031_c0_g1_i1:84-875(-)